MPAGSGKKDCWVKMSNKLKAKATDVRLDVTFCFFLVAVSAYSDILSDLLVYHCKHIVMKIC